jgi:predicted dehydrogenase
MIRLAIAGAGFIANIHAAAAKSLPDVELVAVVDKYPKVAKKMIKKYQVQHYFETIDDLLKTLKVDALVIGTPNYLHNSQAISAMQAGVHVMVEKPMAMNALEAYQMLEASRKLGVLLMVAHCWRFDPEVLWLREQVNSGCLGKIIRTKGYGVHELSGPTGWFTQRKFAGGGALPDMGIHALDTARFLLGNSQPESVFARIGTYYTDYDVDDTSILIVNWKGGAVSYIESGWWQPHTDGPEAATQLYGTKGFGQLFPTYIRNHSPQSLYNDQMSYFVQCIRHNQTPSPGAIEGWINMKVVDAAYKSAKTGKVVRVD